MKRFSAPPALYPPPSQPPSTSSEAPAGIDATATSGNGHGLGPPPFLQQHHPHDPSSKRVKTEQTFESLFDVETHSDVIVRVNGDQFVFHAHRVILEMKSDVMARLLAGLVEKQREEEEEGGGVTSVGSRFVPVLRVTEDPECSQVFSRFLYFLYSGAVWLHQDYVLPLFRLAHKYNVRPLLAHCETYILQVLAKSCSGPHHHDPRPMHPHGHHQHHNNFSYSYSHHHPHHHPSLHHSHSPSSAPTTVSLNCPPYTGSGFLLEVICDLYEDDVFAGDVGQTCFRVLCCQFRQLVRLPRWARCRVQTVCELISSDQCSVEENLILVSATDYMKQNNLSDKKQIESILANIRYPCLNRRLLYHLHKNGSFKNFPYIQELMLNAMKYHCFKDLAEAKEDFVGVQFTPRIGGGQPLRRASMQLAVAAPTTDCFPEHMAFPESAYSLESELPVVLTRSRHSQV